ncbi:FAD-binding oxidoreductase [Aspergillus tanneri]|uniref:FAD-binding PCMH-type domain-containing protein n=1 Tax=Aspergillus tanneri TaxID=1220188 RepID=A0A5M9MYM5_9EURO|nr:uncharacterized protein ATNIH1004_003759 [Aspergillus tanneri]KAA8651066.1 hypothetical protein ATNIH1004_003759 [Aspergillus tanneri]
MPTVTALMSWLIKPLIQLLGLLPLATVVFASSNICDILNYQIPGRVSYSDDLAYTASVSSYYSGFERALRPSCIFRPSTTAEVSEFVQLVSVNATTKWSLPQFAVRGGGHTLFTGAANINGSVTVDMRSMNSLALSDDHKIASVGGGSIFSDFYPRLVPHNLSVMGGRVPGIGVGGFTTRGGLNFLSREHGFSCDNIYGYEVVLANGSVIYASASSNYDLWLALKGGSNNFGIVTRFDLATFPQGLMWGGMILFNYTDSIVDHQAQDFSNFMDPTNFDSAADMAVILNFEDGSFSIGNFLFYTKPVANPPVYQPFTSLPSPIFDNLGFNNCNRVRGDLAESWTLYIPFKYLNYADKSQDPFSSYGEANKAHLIAVGKRYDPNELFQKGLPGGFKLFA